MELYEKVIIEKFLKSNNYACLFLAYEASNVREQVREHLKSLGFDVELAITEFLESSLPNNVHEHQSLMTLGLQARATRKEKPVIAYDDE